MRVPELLIAICVAVHAPGTAAADQVLSQDSSWNACGTRIFTEMVIERDDGSVDTVTVPGGVVDGIAMVSFHVGTGRAYPYVRTQNSSGAELYWKERTVTLVPDVNGTTDIADDDELRIAEQVLAHWGDSTQECGELDLRLDSPAAVEVGFDRVNAIKFRHDTWCRPDDAAPCGDPIAPCHDASAIAVTTLCYTVEDGRLLDADIEFNAVNFAFAVDGITSGTGDVMDFRSTLTHEIGHFIGLEHTCWDGINPPTRPIDHLGQPVPDCGGALPVDITEATMYPFQLPGETKKATVEQDDIDGFCAIYPRQGCCNAGGAGGWPGVVVLAVAIITLGRFRSIKLQKIVRH